MFLNSIVYVFLSDDKYTLLLIFCFPSVSKMWCVKGPQHAITKQLMPGR